MHYPSLITTIAAAFSLSLSSQAVGHTLPGQPLHQAKSPDRGFRPNPVTFRLDAVGKPMPGEDKDLASTQGPGSAYEWAATAARSEAASQALPDDALRIVPERRTKSAAYKWEATFLALSAIDAVETISCLNRTTCKEHNPIWGHHPSTGKIVAAKLGLGLVHFGVFKLIADRNPHTALRAAQISAAVQGGVVLLNLKSTF